MRPAWKKFEIGCWALQDRIALPDCGSQENGSESDGGSEMSAKRSADVWGANATWTANGSGCEMMEMSGMAHRGMSETPRRSGSGSGSETENGDVSENETANGGADGGESVVPLNALWNCCGMSLTASESVIPSDCARLMTWLADRKRMRLLTMRLNCKQSSAFAISTGEISALSRRRITVVRKYLQMKTRSWKKQRMWCAGEGRTVAVRRGMWMEAERSDCWPSQPTEKCWDWRERI